MNKEEIDISIMIPSRERFKYLRRSLFSLDILSHSPEKIEECLGVVNENNIAI